MTLIGTILFLVIVAWAIVRLQRDVSCGLRTVFALLVFLPQSLRFDAPGGLFQLTIHRVLIIIAFIYLIRNRTSEREKWPVPNLWLVLLFGASQLLSFLLGTAFAMGAKAILTYGIETALFYVLVSEYVQTEKDFAKLLSSLCYGLAGVAVIATIEKYFHFDPVALLSSSDGGAGLAESGDIAATYPHRILMGYAIVMGVPFSLALLAYCQEPRLRRRMLGVTFLLIGATYFSMSRGPWLGLLLATLGMTVLGNKAVRRQILFAVALALAVWVARPGVRETVTNLYHATFDSDSAKGASYDYRWQLWGVAWDKICTSPMRFLFGCGPGSTQQMDLSYLWYGEEGWQTSVSLIGFTSWDNNYASDLVELGMVGFLLELLLFALIVKALADNWRNSYGEVRILQTGILVSCLIFMFAMTTVFIFAPQMRYLFWTLVAVGSNFARVTASQAANEAALSPDLSGATAAHASGMANGQATA